MKNSDIKTLIVDDDNDFIDSLLSYLQKIKIRDTNTANSFDEAKNILSTYIPDLALLDIDLKDAFDGINVGEYIREKFPHVPIIYFTNNFREDIFEATKAIKPNAFLDKNLDELKVRQAVELAMIGYEEENSTTLQVLPSTCYFAKEYIFVKVGLIFKKVELKDIDYIFYADRYANLQIEGRTYPLNISMKELGKNLPNHIFIQIHQSYIINIQKIEHISNINQQVEVAGKWLPIGVSHRKNFQERLVFIS